MQRPQELQTLVEFQSKAVGKRAADGDRYDVIHVAGVFQAVTSRISRIVRAGEKECGIGSRRRGPTVRPYRRQQFPPYYMQRPYGHQPRYSNLPVQAEVMEGAVSQGAGEQIRPVRQ